MVVSTLVKKLSLAAIGATFMALGTVGSAQAATITFESDTGGLKPNNWMSSESNQVKFSDSQGADLQIGNFGHQSKGKGLAVFNDDLSSLIMDFTTKMDFLSLEFGNDDPRYSQAGDKALLQLFDNNALLDTVNLIMNRDDIMNQTISYTGAAFNKAIFSYSSNTIEVVDNITFREAKEATTVPEPASLLGLLAVGAMGAGSALKRKQKA